MILITSVARPAICSRCHQEIAVLIAASTPGNARRHIVRTPTAYYRTADGPVCPGCYPDYSAERALVAGAAALAEQLRPIALDDETLRVYTRNGRVVRTEPLAAGRSGSNGVHP